MTCLCHLQESQTSSDAGATAGEHQCVNGILSDASSSSSSDSAEDWQSEESERSGVEKGSKEMKRGKEMTEEEEDLGKVPTSVVKNSVLLGVLLGVSFIRWIVVSRLVFL